MVQNPMAVTPVSRIPLGAYEWAHQQCGCVCLLPFSSQLQIHPFCLCQNRCGPVKYFPFVNQDKAKRCQWRGGRDITGGDGSLVPLFLLHRLLYLVGFSGLALAVQCCQQYLAASNFPSLWWVCSPVPIGYISS